MKIGLHLFSHTLLLGCCLLLAGCPAHLPFREPESMLRWPAPPEPPRIRYLYTFADAGELGIRPGLLDWLAGKREYRGLQRPAAILVAGERIYVADQAGALFLFRTGRRKLVRTQFGGGKRLLSPVGLATGEADSVYVVDSGLGRIVIYDGNLETSRIVRDGLKRPTGILWNPRKRELAVAEAGADRILILNQRGVIQRTLGEAGVGSGQFNTPTHLAFLGKGKDTLLVTDALNCRVVALDDTGRQLFALGRPGRETGSLARPKGVAVDSEGHIYVVDALFGNIQIFNAQGELLLYFGTNGPRKPGCFSLPGGIFIDAKDRIYVADTHHSRVQVFQFMDGSGCER